MYNFVSYEIKILLHNFGPFFQQFNIRMHDSTLIIACLQDRLERHLSIVNLEKYNKS